MITSKASENIRGSNFEQQRVFRTDGHLYRNVPLHRLDSTSKFVTGKVLLGDIEDFFFSDVDILLRKDLTDKYCAE